MWIYEKVLLCMETTHTMVNCGPIGNLGTYLGPLKSIGDMHSVVDIY